VRAGKESGCGPQANLPTVHLIGQIQYRVTQFTSGDIKAVAAAAAITTLTHTLSCPAYCPLCRLGQSAICISWVIVVPPPHDDVVPTAIGKREELMGGRTDGCLGTPFISVLAICYMKKGHFCALPMAVLFKGNCGISRDTKL
jgi:hypothetical protein